MSTVNRNLRALALCYAMLGVATLACVAFSPNQGGSSSPFNSAGLWWPPNTGPHWNYLPFVMGPFARIANPQDFLAPLMTRLGLALAALWFVTAAALQARQWPVVCLIAALVTTALYPLGTVLGVFTILQLNNAETAAAFAGPRLPFHEWFPHKGDDFGDDAESKTESN